MLTVVSYKFENTCFQEELVHSIVRSHGILITAYSSVLIYQEILLQYDWHYAILDEGHKIRNPDAQITIAAKQVDNIHTNQHQTKGYIRHIGECFLYIYTFESIRKTRIMKHINQENKYRMYFQY